MLIPPALPSAERWALPLSSSVSRTLWNSPISFAFPFILKLVAYICAAYYLNESSMMLWSNPLKKKSSNSEINPGFHGQFPLQRRNTSKAEWPWCTWCWQPTLKGRAHSDTLCPVLRSHTGGKTSAPGRIAWMISWLSSVPHYWEWWGSGVGLQLSWKAVCSFKVIDLLLSATYSKQVRRTHSYDIIFFIYACLFLFSKIYLLHMQDVVLGLSTCLIWHKPCEM